MLAEAISVASISVPVRTATPFASNCYVIDVNNTRSSPPSTSCARNRTKAVRFGVASDMAKPQKRPKLTRSSNASANFTSDKSYQIASSIARSSAGGGQPSSPLFGCSVDSGEVLIDLCPIDQRRYLIE
jgi:hypothetical protein